MRFLKQLREQGVTGALVKDVYEAYATDLDAIKKKYDRYHAENLPIHNRDYGELEPDIEAHLNNDFFGEIVDLKVGHFAGKAASYSYDKTRSDYETAYEVMSRFQVVNNLAHIDSQTTKDAAIAGKAYRLLYIDLENELRVTTLKPYEVVIFYEHDPTESEFAFRFYGVEDAEGELVIHADVYDSTHMYEFVLNDKVSETFGDFTLLNERLHQFVHCPVIMYRNNDEELGDADKVLALIDAYDKTTSDLNAEITMFRLAYFAFIGAMFDNPEEVKQLKKTGAFNLPQGADAKFITKQILSEPIEKHLDRLRDDVYRFSKTPNLHDDSMGGTVTGIGMRYKHSGIESKSLTFERSKMQSDIRQFKIAATFFRRKHRIEFDAYSVIIEHYRNIPTDTTEIINELRGYFDMGVPLSYLVTKMPGVDDPQYVLDLIKEEEVAFKNDTEKITLPSRESTDETPPVE